MSSRRKKSFATRLIEANDREYIASIAREYSESGVFCNQEVIAENHGCTVKDIQKLIAYAIVHCYISYAAAVRCMTKSHENQSHHTSSDTTNSVSYKYYAKLLRERYDFVLHHYPDKSAESVFSYYLRHPYISDVYRDTGLSQIEFNIVLSRAIMFGIATDEELEKFKTIAMSPHKRTHSTERFIESICAYRDTICKKLPEEISLVKAQIDSYDDNVIPNEAEDYSLDDLLRKLDNLEDQLGLAESDAIEFLENRLRFEEPQF